MQLVTAASLSTFHGKSVHSKIIGPKLLELLTKAWVDISETSWIPALYSAHNNFRKNMYALVSKTVKNTAVVFFTGWTEKKPYVTAH